MNSELEANIIDLQIRVTHQESSIDELTKHNLDIEKRMLAMEKELLAIKDLLKEMAPSLVVPQSEETPPPHY